MGMAASQARYLALVARKSNCEYEGQQINQSRLLLANQTANLFNQMLGLTVPVPPSTQDFTKTQYSFSDGSHSFVIDDWKQLSTNDPEYNYMVNAHYYTDVYTGSMKRMSDPQVQMSNPGAPVAQIEDIENAMVELRRAEAEANAKYNYWQEVKTTNEARIADYMRAARRYNETRSINDGLLCTTVLAPNETNGVTVYKFAENDTDYKGYKITAFTDIDDASFPTGYTDEAEIVLTNIKDMVTSGIITLDELNAALLEASGNEWFIHDVSELDFDPGATTYSDAHKYILGTFALLETGTANLTGDVVNDVVPTQYDGENSIAQYLVLAKDLADLDDAIRNGNTGSISGFPIEFANCDPDAGVEPDNFQTAAYYAGEIETLQDEIDTCHTAYVNAQNDYNAALAAYNALNQPEYIGNCPLTYLDTLDEDQEIELKQVVKDMIAQGINTDIINHFDANGNYLGGVYSFSLYGTTYYTTYNNLMDAYNSQGVSNNLIDDQYRMPYYNASYISTRVDEKGKALLETDGAGRFTTIRFENDSATYTLNVETITDDAAYEDAMNKYYYENALYDKKVQDINAKTSIIQREDQELELRLKQLDTEQNALKTEIDAVSKIVKDNVESSFKTFGG